MKKLFSIMLLFATLLFASCEKDKTIPAIGVDSVSLDQTTFTLSVGGTTTLKATILQETAPLKDVSWITCDSAVATVNENGVVGAVAPGEAVITVITADGERMASCTITVTPKIIG